MQGIVHTSYRYMLQDMYDIATKTPALPYISTMGSGTLSYVDLMTIEIQLKLRMHIAWLERCAYAWYPNGNER